MGGPLAPNVETGRREKQNLNWLRIKGVAPYNAGIYICVVNEDGIEIERCGELSVISKLCQRKFVIGMCKKVFKGLLLFYAPCSPTHKDFD